MVLKEKDRGVLEFVSFFGCSGLVLEGGKIETWLESCISRAIFFCCFRLIGLRVPLYI